VTQAGRHIWSGLRLAYWFAARPQDIPRYVRNLTIPPIKSGLPWLTFTAIDFLDSWVKPEHKVFEYGSGGSTVFFAKRAESVKAVEHNASWGRRVIAAGLGAGLTNISLIVKPAGREPPLAGSAYCDALSQSCDIIVIDGWGLGKWNDSDRRAVLSRAACLARAELFIRRGGIIVLDDAHRLPPLPHRARSRRSFKGLGPWRVGASTTDILFY
jgi:hypothetical protein